MNEELLRVLDAREKRWQQRLALARGSRRTLITVTLSSALIGWVQGTGRAPSKDGADGGAPETETA